MAISAGAANPPLTRPFHRTRARGTITHEPTVSGACPSPVERGSLCAYAAFERSPIFTSTLSPLARAALSEPDEEPLDHEAADGYAVKVLVTAGELPSLLAQLDYALQSLSGYRSSQSMRNTTRADHIAYHLENHLIRVVSIYDRALQLTNLVFRLGLPQRACSSDTVAKNRHVQLTSVPRALNRLNERVKPWRERRNVVIHRRGYTDSDLHELEGYFLLDKELQDDDEEGRVVVQQYRNMFKTLTDNYVRSRREELQTLNKQLDKDLQALFDELQPVFIVEHRKLRGDGDGA